MSRIKVLVAATTFPRWKDDTQPPFVFELSRRLASYFDITVLAPHAKGAALDEEMENLIVHRYRYLPFSLGTLAYDGGIAPKLKKNRLNYFQVPFFVLFQFFSLVRLVLLKKIDVIHAHWIIPQGLTAVLCKLLRKRDIKVLATSHGGDILGFRGNLSSKIKKFVLNHVDCLTVVSHALREEAIKYGCSCPIHVSPMGVDTKTFNPGRCDDSIRKEYGIDGPFLLFVGRLAEKKGLEYLIRAMPQVLNEYSSAKLLVIGDGQLRQNLESLAAELNLGDSVIFAGSKPHDQLPKYFASADIFIGPSIVAKGGDSEGFGLVFAEAMSCGTPVIASDLPAIRDIVRDGETGFLVQQKDSAHIGERIVDVLKDNRILEMMNIAARKHIVKNFDWEIVTDNYAKLIEEMMDNRGNVRNQ
jgi:glycosyltransferase involved in cell wall biosynthesis